jgi:glycosyltransferase involved in cell wall biosynthesis
MKIGFVAEPYEESHASGMGYSVLETMRNLPLQGQQHELVYYSSRPIDRNLVPAPFKNVIIPKGFIKQFFWFLFFRIDVDVLLFNVPLLPFVVPHTRVVPLCKELGSQKIRPGNLQGRMRDFIRDHLLMPLSLSRGAHIITSSQATKDDLIKFYKIPSTRVSVVYEGFQDLGRFESVAEHIDEHMKPFFLFVGKIKGRKNVHGIVSAFILFKKKTGSNEKLVIVGDYGGDYYHAMLQEISVSGFAKDVHFIGYVSTGLLYSLYTNALAFVFPSLNEGFGMPIIEAMSLGTPVITSEISSMVEVAGGAALLVDPFDIGDIARAMGKMSSDAALRADLIQKGLRRAKTFSWSKTARAYLDLLSSL